MEACSTVTVAAQQATAIWSRRFSRSAMARPGRSQIQTDQKKAALAKFNAEFNTLLPGVIQGALPLVNVYDSKVQGLKFSGRSIPLLETVSLAS